MQKTASLFVNGRSHAEKLSKGFRFKGNRVKIRKKGEKVILEPLTNTK